MQRVAILGSGLGAMSAAFYLSATPELRERFAVTVYTDGHLLGGKASNGRGEHDRIEEHGLHMMLGWYENAFRFIRDTYEAFEPPADSPFQSWEDAFEPQRRITLGDQHDGEWEAWTVTLPRRNGTPGDGTPLMATEDFLGSMVVWLDSVLKSAMRARRRMWRRDERAQVVRARQQARRKGTVRPRLFNNLLDRIALLWSERDANAPTEVFSGMLEMLDEFAEWLEADLHRAGDNLRRAVRLLQLGVVVVRGYVNDILRPKADFQSLNHLEFRDWLRLHGATDELAWFAPIRALYTLGFAFEDGQHANPDKGRIAAGVALKILLRLGLDYKNAPLWRMKAGMGDTIFAPLYKVLQRRGVQFRFFHKVHRLRSAGLGIDAIELVARPYDGTVLTTVKGLPCWPEEPASEPHTARPLTLRRGTDYDQVVLGIPVPALPQLVQDLVRHRPAWRRLVQGIPHTATQNLQLWVEEDLDELGWTEGSTVMTGFSPELDSWASMSELLPMESFPPTVKGLHYFCACLPEGRTEDQTRELQQRWLAERLPSLWPDWSGRVFSRYERNNTHGSERYMQSFEGTIRYRLAPGDSRFEGLVLAGDWTLTSLNAGSAEAAVQSGMLAAQALGAQLHIVDPPPQRD